MGWIRHHAIVVTGGDYEFPSALSGQQYGAPLVRVAHARATELGCIVTPIVSTSLNGFVTFVVAPDGSKERWLDSAVGDDRRESFKAWLRQHATEQDDDRQYALLSWVEVWYGSDDTDARVVEHAWSDGPVPE